MFANTDANLEVTEVLCYVLLTSGPKPRSQRKAHLAGRTQITNLKKAAKDHSAKGFELYWEFGRSPRRLSDLPILEQILMTASNVGGVVFMDDIGRLFRSCPLKERIGLFEELDPFQSNLVSLKHGRPMEALKQIEVQTMLTAVGPQRFVFKTKSSKEGEKQASRKAVYQTEDARNASTIARSSFANEKARALAVIGGKLTKKFDRVTNLMIAEEANKQGLRTTRDGLWRADTVSRTLKRLDRETLVQCAKRTH